MPQPIDAEALHRQLQERAYAIWEQEGRPGGRDIDHWLKAEGELTAAAANQPDSGGLPASGKKPD